MSDTSEFFTAVGVVTLIKNDSKISYSACPAQKCGAKVTVGGDGQFFCAKCNKSYPQSSERYLLSFIAADYTGSSWISCFNEAAVTVLGNIDAASLVAMRDQAVQPGAAPGSGEQNYERVFYDASFKWFTVRLRAKAEVYREEQRTRLTANIIKPLDFVAESKRLLGIIGSYGI